ncbi:hypothetical protein [Paenibacillus sp. F4]|uniref:hypothetical protein n=1 Tax=Paenibacillus sp. F4 TaxID=357385 RepID=UPI000C9ECEC5|nr:hypothetical protein [Paenibacillus sp. F4]PNQ78898.1 hypothetical protein C1T21_22900 [Paenibacillus sp. F4]
MNKIMMIDNEIVGITLRKMQNQDSTEQEKTLANFYEVGMKEVLYETALSHYLTQRPMKLKRPDIIDANKKLTVEFGNLYDQLNSEAKDALSTLEDAFIEAHALEMEESFVIGFIAGYRMLKGLNVSRREGF